MRAFMDTAALPSEMARFHDSESVRRTSFTGCAALWAEGMDGKSRKNEDSADMSRTEQEVVFEICNKGNVIDFIETVSEMMRVIRKSGGVMFCSDVCGHSFFQPAHHYGEPDLIVLGFKYQRQNRHHLLWEILRLTGFLLLGIPNPEDSPLEVEIKVWDIAYGEWRKYPQLLPHEAAFTKYKADCLRPYQEAWQGSWRWNDNITRYMN